MKKLTACLILFVLFTVSFAYAESPVGRWSGKGTIFGFLSGSCSATFKESGSVTMSSGSYSVSGKWSNGTIRVKNGDDTIKVRFWINDDGSMTMSSSYDGMSGRAKLRRRGKQPDSSTQHSINGIWKNEDGDIVRIYSDGYFHYTWYEENAEGELIQNDFISTFTLSDEDKDVLVLLPFEKINEEDTEITPILVKSSVSDDELVLTYEEAEYRYSYQQDADEKPESNLFVPYVALERTDKGQAVELLQEQLTQAGCLNDKIDGIYGAKTEEAVMLFEHGAGLTEDGIADTEVRKLLLERYAILDEAEN